MSYKTDDLCLAKVDDLEPIFVLRAQDRLAPTLVRLWAAYVTNAHMELRAVTQPFPQAKLVEALKCAQAMEAWQHANGSKTPD